MHDSVTPSSLRMITRFGSNGFAEQQPCLIRIKIGTWWLIAEGTNAIQIKLTNPKRPLEHVTSENFTKLWPKTKLQQQLLGLFLAKHQVDWNYNGRKWKWARHSCRVIFCWFGNKKCKTMMVDTFLCKMKCWTKQLQQAIQSKCNLQNQLCEKSIKCGIYPECDVDPKCEHMAILIYGSIMGIQLIQWRSTKKYWQLCKKSHKACWQDGCWGTLWRKPLWKWWRKPTNQ